jgi:hypothetical protein
MVLSQLVGLADFVFGRGLQNSSTPRQKGEWQHLLLRVRRAGAPSQTKCSALERDAVAEALLSNVPTPGLTIIPRGEPRDLAASSTEHLRHFAGFAPG